MLQAKNLQIGYSSALASAEALTLMPGDLVALVGRNGSGKSTLMETLCGNLSPIKGGIHLESRSLSSWSKDELATKIARVDARFAGVPYLKVIDYVLLGRTPYLGWMGKPQSTDVQWALKALEFTHALHLQNKETTSLSDGERQLVSIARAIAQNPTYLFLDEPTAFLDFFHRKQIFTLLEDLAKTHRKAILFSTHELDVVVDHKLSLILVPQNGIIVSHNPVENRSSLEKILS
jgi:iron complex transport system ATP-binding protein